MICITHQNHFLSETYWVMIQYECDHSFGQLCYLILNVGLLSHPLFHNYSCIFCTNIFEYWIRFLITALATIVYLFGSIRGLSHKHSIWKKKYIIRIRKWFKARLYPKWHAPEWDVGLLGGSKSKISKSLLEKWSGASPYPTTMMCAILDIILL